MVLSIKMFEERPKFESSACSSPSHLFGGRGASRLLIILFIPLVSTVNIQLVDIVLSTEMFEERLKCESSCCSSPKHLLGEDRRVDC